MYQGIERFAINMAISFKRIVSFLLCYLLENLELYLIYLMLNNNLNVNYVTLEITLGKPGKYEWIM